MEESLKFYVLRVLQGFFCCKNWWGINLIKNKKVPPVSFGKKTHKTLEIPYLQSTCAQGVAENCWWTSVVAFKTALTSNWIGLIATFSKLAP